jgi:hypothetical protein
MLCRCGPTSTAVSWPWPASTSSGMPNTSASRRDRAGLAFEVASGWEGRGIATLLLAQLADHASRRGIRIFTADVLAANHRMLSVFRDSGFTVEISVGPGVLRVEMPTEISRPGGARFEGRTRAAAVAAVTDVLRPETIAVVAGVMSDPDIGPVVACGAGGRTVSALEDILIRLSALAADRPEIAELDCNPVIVSTQGASVVDARIRLEPPPLPRPCAALDR